MTRSIDELKFLFSSKRNDVVTNDQIIEAMEIAESFMDALSDSGEVWINDDNEFKTDYEKFKTILQRLRLIERLRKA